MSRLRINKRLVLTLLLAVLCVAAFLVVWWYQLRQTVKESLQRPEVVRQTGSSSVVTALPIATQDATLLTLHAGDQAALRGDWQQAKVLYQEVVTTNNSLLSLRKLAESQLQLSDSEGLEATLVTLAERGARREDIDRLRLSLLLRTGNTSQVKEELQQLEDSPQKSYLEALLAIISENQEGALVHLQAVEDGWDPLLRTRAKVLINAYDEYNQFERESSAHLQTVLARALAEVQECPLAIGLATKASAALPTYRDAWLMQGFCSVTIGEYEQAITALEKAYTLDRQKPEIQYFLARSYRAVGRYEDASVYFRRAKANGFEPVDEITVALAKVAIEAGDFSAARLQYRDLKDKEGPLQQDGFYGFIESSLNINAFEDAYQVATEMIKLYPEDAKAFELLGVTANKTERVEVAKTALQRALELNPYLTVAQEVLKDL